MTVAVKICGLRTSDALEAAIGSGADLIGLVFYPRSPRHVSIHVARALATQARGRARIVALLVDPDDTAVDDVVLGVRPDLLQLHGREDRDRVLAIAARSGLPLMKAFRVATRADADAAASFAPLVDRVLFDAAPSPTAALPGGNGEAFDWSHLDGIKGRFPFMLSGGLTAGNVARAIQITGAAAVDVSSGVESAPGEKDADLIRAFLRAAKTAKEPLSNDIREGDRPRGP